MLTGALVVESSTAASQMKAILALDQGTTSSRAILFDERASILGIAQKEFSQIFPQPGWVEHDPREILSTQFAVMEEVIAAVPGVDVAAIGITNQRETTLLWDRSTGEPVANAIVWQDRRTAAMCDELREHEPLFRRKTGLLLDPYFSGTKIRWLLDHHGCRSNLAFGTVDTWLIWHLTGGKVHVTDTTNASRTLLFDIHRREWDDELLDILQIPRDILPRVVSSSEVVAHTATGIPIAGIAGDQQAALFGQRCMRAGTAKNTYGTGCFVVMHTGESAVESEHGLLATITADQQYALEGSIFVAGAAVQWLRDQMGIIRTAADIEGLAASVEDSGGVIFVPAFTGLGAPHWDPDARGAILGLTRGSSAAHIARATLEAIALQTADVLEAMRADSGIDVAELRVDGAASTNDLLMQIQADLAGVRVVRGTVSETTALGAAYLAAEATGFQWAAGNPAGEARVFEPSLDEPTRAAHMARWRAAVARVR